MKDNKKVFLTTIVAILLVFSNVISANITSILGSPITCSIFIYPITFLGILLLTSFYGKEEGHRGIIISLIAQIIIFALSTLICNLPSTTESLEISNDLKIILAPDVTNGFYHPSINLMIGTLLSFVIAQLVSVHLYSYLKKTTDKSISAFFALLSGLVIDAIIFILFTTLGTNTQTSLSSAITTQIVIRIIIAAILTLIFYVATLNAKKEKEHENEKITKEEKNTKATEKQETPKKSTTAKKNSTATKNSTPKKPTTTAKKSTTKKSSTTTSKTAKKTNK